MSTRVLPQQLERALEAIGVNLRCARWSLLVWGELDWRCSGGESEIDTLTTAASDIGRSGGRVARGASSSHDQDQQEKSSNVLRTPHV
ncbi:hypothetical protein Aduo_008653 [Ancylostoma duodenale]